MNFRFFAALFFIQLLWACNPRIAEGLRKNDLKKDVELQTSKGTVVLRLSDSTPLHRNNFLRLAKEGFYDGILFHRVIRNFMIQAGDPQTRPSGVKQFDTSAKSYTIPAEFRTSMFHRKGVLAAARMGDDVNPSKASSGSQFYIVHGRTFTDAGLDSVQRFRLKGYVIPDAHRSVYKSAGGAPHLDQNYTVFGEVIRGLEVVDSIASVRTGGRDKPLDDVRIIRTRLIRR